jgi:sortase A
VKVSISRRAVTWAERGLFAGALVLLGYCGVVVLDTWTFQSQERREFDRQLSASPTPPERSSLPIVSGGLIGRIEIGRLGISAIVMEGTSWATLQRAVGHIKGTAQPGASGNVAISGHRDTFFRPLRKIRQGDMITVTTLRGKFSYRVVSTSIVDPSEVSVLDAGSSESLTLVTCYPFYFVGSAPDRFVVRAERIS